MSTNAIAAKFNVGTLFGASGLELTLISSIYSINLPIILTLYQLKRNGVVITKVSGDPSSSSEYSYNALTGEIRVYDNTGYYVAESYVYASNTDTFSANSDLSGSTGSTVKWSKKLLTIGGVSYSIENTPAGFLEVGGSSITLENGENEFSFLESNDFTLNNRECKIYRKSGATWTLVYDGISSNAQIGPSSVDLTIREKISGLSGKYTQGDSYSETIVTDSSYSSCPEDSLFLTIPYYQNDRTNLFYSNSKNDDSVLIGEVTVPPEGASRTIYYKISSGVIVGKADSASTDIVRTLTALETQAVSVGDTVVYIRELSADKFHPGEWAIIYFASGYKYQITATNQTVLFGDGTYRKFLVDTNIHTTGIGSSFPKTAYHVFRFTFSIFANTQQGKCSLLPASYLYVSSVSAGVPTYSTSNTTKPWIPSSSTTTSGKKVVYLNRNSGAAGYWYCNKDSGFFSESFGTNNSLDFASIEVYYRFASSRKNIGAVIKQILDDFGVQTSASSFSSFDSSYPMEASFYISENDYEGLPSGIELLQEILSSIGCYLYRDSSYSVGIRRIADMSSASGFSESKFGRDSYSVGISYEESCYSLNAENKFFPETSTEYSVTNPRSFYLNNSTEEIKQKMFTKTMDTTILTDILRFKSSNRKVITLSAHNDALGSALVGENLLLGADFTFEEKEYKIVSINNGEVASDISLCDFGV